MPKILSSESSGYVGRPGFKKLGNAISKNSAEGKRRVTKKFGGVTRLIARDPANSNTQNEVVDQFTNNPNPLYDPSKAPGTVGTVRVPDAPKTYASGRGKILMRPKKSWRRRRLS